jgi:hypothetical protein
MLLGVALSSTGQAASTTSVQNVSQDGADSLLPRVAQDPNGNVHVVWDTTEGGRKVRWRKGTWNAQANRYDFGPSVVIADVGGFQYSTPSIGISPNGTVLATWSNGFRVYGRQWNMNDAQPGGNTFQIMPGFDSNIAVDSNNHFHIVSNGDFYVQYCELIGQQCAKRDSFSRDLNARPDVTVDRNNGVHAVWYGQGIRYRYRAAGQEWGNTEVLAGGGNDPQISADGKDAGGKSNVYIVWSQDYNIQMCRKIVGETGSGCAEKRFFDGAEDLSPTVGATRSSNVAVTFYDNKFKSIWLNTREDGAWAPSQAIADGPTKPDATSRPYSNRISSVWSENYEIRISTVIVKEGQCDAFIGAGQGLDVSPAAINPDTDLFLPIITVSPRPVC